MIILLRLDQSYFLLSVMKRVAHDLKSFFELCAMTLYALITV